MEIVRVKWERRRGREKDRRLSMETDWRLSTEASAHASDVAETDDIDSSSCIVLAVG